MLAQLRKSARDLDTSECGVCHAAFTDYNEIVPYHIEPKGMGGAQRDDHPEHVQAVHRKCNFEKGSRRLRPLGSR